MTILDRIDALLRLLGLTPTKPRRDAVQAFHDATHADRGAKGGHARAANMKPKDRSEAARAAARARWGKKGNRRNGGQ